MTTLLVASGHGQLKQLHHLLSRLEVGPERFWISTETSVSRTLLADEDKIFLPTFSSASYRGVGRAALRVHVAMRRLKPDRVIVLGDDFALSVLPLAIQHRIESTYIESVIFQQAPSRAGRMLERFSRLALFTQHETWANERWTFGGCVFDGFTPIASPSIPPVRKLVVKIGTPSYERLIHRLRVLAPPTTAVQWQTGQPDDLPLEALSTAMYEADAVVTDGGVAAILTAMESDRFPLISPRRPDREQIPDERQVDLARWLQIQGLAMAVDADEISWSDVCVSASWRITQSDAIPPFVLDR